MRHVTSDAEVNKCRACAPRHTHPKVRPVTNGTCEIADFISANYRGEGFLDVRYFITFGDVTRAGRLDRERRAKNRTVSRHSRVRMMPILFQG